MCHFPSCLRRRCSVEKVLGFCHSSVRDCEYEVAVAVNLWLKMHWGTKLVVSGFFSLLKQLVHTSMYLAVQDAAEEPGIWDQGYLCSKIPLGCLYSDGVFHIS